MQTNTGFNQLASDPCVFVDKNRQIILAIYVDDILVACPNDNIADQVYHELQISFELKRGNKHGEINKFLGIQYITSADKILLSQEQYIDKLAELYRCEDANNRDSSGEYIHNSEAKIDEKLPIANLVGSLLFIATRTRPDILYSVRRLASFISKPNATLWKAAKNILIYIITTKHFKLRFNRPKDMTLKLFMDASFASSYEEERSVTGILIMLDDCPISWSSTTQQIASSSAADSELYALCEGVKEFLITDILAHELLTPLHKIILCDNKILVNSVNDQPKKKMRAAITRAKFVRDQLIFNNYKLSHVGTKQQKADIFTKRFKIDFNPSQFYN